MTPWTYGEFDARVDEYHEALSRRDRSLVTHLALMLGSIFLTIAVLPPTRAHFGRWVLGVCAGLAGFAAYIVGTSRAYSRRHAVRCPACSAPLTAVADRIADVRQFGSELPPGVRCPQCQVVIIASAT